MAGNRTADELLKWGLEHAPMTEDGQSSVTQVTSEIAAGRRPDLQDPALYNAIMGKSEAQMMQEELGVAVDMSRSETDRLTALDNFEMLIEQVDNANTMESLQMWPVFLKLLQSHQEPEIQVQAAWVVGTATQNNDKAQAVALHHGILKVLLPLLDAHKPELRSKAVYAISAILGHHPAAVAQFAEFGGWEKLNHALADSNLGVRRKVAFLLNQLLIQDPLESSESFDETETGKHSVPNTQVVAKDNGNANMPPVPLEQGPATKKIKVKHPDVGRALVEHGILDSLITSLLPEGSGSLAVCNGQAVRSDIDYDEKAVQVILTLTGQQRATLPLPKAKLQQLVQVLRGPPVDKISNLQTFAEELGVDLKSVDALEKKTE
ncbi:hsp70 nucleotide exchange factor fes1 [Malassezia psittaci]|uniref:Hsp70 nucleotide exchange factor fes1 n=1 Tax=Malassezia psittaci TaxID=1821823 RepID=A0AAF0FET2_9BASI|nr:hsp70 nucleotide exchange factor fes1 [Malassezia psittaci]